MSKKNYLAIWVLMSVLLVPGLFSFKASARDSLPAGGLRNLKVEEFDPIVIDDKNSTDSTGENSKLQRNSSLLKNLNLSNVDTGEHYKYLSEDEKILYEAMYSIISSKNYVPYADRNAIDKDKYKVTYYKGKTTFANAYDISDLGDSINRAGEALYFDHPGNVEFYMCHSAFGTLSYSTGVFEDYLIITAYYDDTKFEAINKSIQNSLNTIVADIKKNGLENNKWAALTELNVHDYYAKMVTYDHECAGNGNSYQAYFDLAHTAYGSLCDKNAVCDGYSTGYEMIMDKLGINTMVIAGYANTPSSKGGHAWNIVKLDGNWYEVDTTWASPSSSSGNVIHDYFNRTTDEYTKGISNATHKRTENDGYVGFRMPKATGTHYTYKYLTETSEANLSTDSNYVALKDMTLSKDSIEAEVGQSFTIVPSFTPSNATNKNYALSSNNTDVAKVSGNTVSCEAAGEAVITVKSEDGGITKTCKVTVKTPPSKESDKDTQTEGNSNSGNTSKDNSSENNSSDNNKSNDENKQGDKNTEEKTSEDSASKETVTSKSTGSSVSISIGSAKGTYIVNDMEDPAVTFKTAANKKSTSLTIPETISDENGFTYKVTEIASGIKKNNAKLKKLTVPATVKKIGRAAFKNCSGLKTIRIYGNNLQTVQSGAFSKINKDCKITIVASDRKKYNKIVKMLKKAGAKNSTFKYKKG
ncbi:leucine-rich repeat protein [Butyrivibrio sp. AE3004]|uniref:leucine-rich repeat protein n=1 Tax=Butyrivibrio sp. AE3004 TaxID=1506994 RepID=UPI000493F941|nr:leucine-rich repeat protein [Butyrivibrio sp. AE3004]